jgi:hypothetical protein
VPVSTGPHPAVDATLIVCANLPSCLSAPSEFVAHAHEDDLRHGPRACSQRLIRKTPTDDLVRFGLGKGVTWVVELALRAGLQP